MSTFTYTCSLQCITVIKSISSHVNITPSKVLILLNKYGIPFFMNNKYSFLLSNNITYTFSMTEVLPFFPQKKWRRIRSKNIEIDTLTLSPWVLLEKKSLCPTFDVTTKELPSALSLSAFLFCTCVSRNYRLAKSTKFPVVLSSSWVVVAVRQL